MWNLERYIASIEDRRSAIAGLFGTSTCFMIGLVVSYLLFVLWLGRRFMEKRPPYSLKRVLIIYNLFQVISNGYHVYKVHKVTSHDDGSYWCHPMLYDRTDERGMEMFYVVYFYYTLKIVDLLDTIFFVLRKKWNQVTFLHVAHHAIMVVLIWTAVRVFPGGTSVIPSAVNCMVHMAMYGYYLLAALHLPGVSLIKPFVTIFQLVQFVFIISLLLFNNVFCSLDKPVVYQNAIVAVNVFFFILFMKFYRKTYRHPGHQGFVRKVL